MQKTEATFTFVEQEGDRDRVADEVKDFAPSITFDIPNGPCFSSDGLLYIAERNRVLAFPAAEFFFKGPDPPEGVVVAQGELVPPEEESFDHTARVCDIGPDGKLYISLGQPHNVQPEEKLEMYDEIGIGGIIRLNTDGSGREVYTRGVRNSVGQDFNPATGELWWTDNQVDGMGDDIPPGELNRQTAAGQHFGFPWTTAGSKFRNMQMCRTCHGIDGFATMPIAPHIGGEPEAYLEAQLMAFKTGQREHEMMTVVTAGLDAQQISDVAAWYGAHEATAILPEGVKAEDAPQACVSCHGADGISELLDAPNLAGETNIYLDTQLKAFKRGNRQHEITSEVAAELSDEEIREIADWYAAVSLEIVPPQE
ncbi:c-type cytochrome [Sulfitobacter sediminilitoris]